MAYEIIDWKNKGETGAKPINRDNLRHMDNGILNLDTYKAEIMPLLTVSDTAPVECERGDLYYNTTTELIYVATQLDTWSEEGTTPSTFSLYVDLSSSKLYYYDGTNFNSYGSGGSGETLPIGIILPFSDDTIPEGYMLCDGRAISRTTYSSLFSIIGTTYGAGDGSTTFNLPNLKGRVPVGYDSTDSDFDTLGETGGEKEHMHYNGMSAYNNQLTVSNTNSDSSHSADELYTITGTNGFNGVGTQNVYAYSTESGSSLQPYQVVNYIIKVSQTTSTQAQVVDGYSTSTTDSYSCNYVNELIKSSQGYIEIGDIQIIYGAVSMTFQPGENYQTIQFEKSFTDNNYIVTLTFQYQAAYYTQLGPVVYEKNTTNVKLGAYNSHTGNVPETLGYMIIGKKSTN